MQVVSGAIEQQGTWTIKCDDAVKTSVALLPLTRPRETLSVELNFSLPTEALQEMLAMVSASQFEGNLELRFLRSLTGFIAVDELVKQLRGAK